VCVCLRWMWMKFKRIIVISEHDESFYCFEHIKQFSQNAPLCLSLSLSLALHSPHSTPIVEATLSLGLKRAIFTQPRFTFGAYFRECYFNIRQLPRALFPFPRQRQQQRQRQKLLNHFGKSRKFPKLLSSGLKKLRNKI
jgi:hypothetical protein